MNAYLDDQNDGAVFFKKAIDAAMPSVDCLNDAPAVKRRQRDQIEYTEGYGIYKEIKGQRFQKELQIYDRNIDVINDKQMQRAEQKKQ